MAWDGVVITRATIGTVVGVRHSDPAAEPRSDASPPRSSGGRAARALVAMLTVIVLCGTGFAWAVKSNMLSGLNFSDALTALGTDSPKSQHGDANILLIGLDSRKAMDGSDLPAQFVTDELHAGDSDVGGYNTNTLILVHVPGDGSRATAVAIPRDDFVSVPGYGMRKIKEAYGLAKYDEGERLVESGVTDPAILEQRSRDAGRRATLTTVQNLLQVPIDHFAEVNLIGFYHIAQALGPLQVCLNSPVQDDFSGADFPAGVQFLDPAQALSFVRQRHGLDNGDLDRTRRQQAFISAVIANLKSTGVIGNIGKMQGLLDVVKKDVVLDAGLNPVKFATQSANLTAGNLDFHTLPVEGYENINGQDVNIVSVPRLRAEVARLFDPEAAAAAAVAATPTGREVVDVYNGTTRDGLAGATSYALAAQGWRVGEVGSGDTATTTTVRYGPGGQAAAQAIADLYYVTATASSALPADRVALTLGADSPDTPPEGPPPGAYSDGADSDAVTVSEQGYYADGAAPEPTQTPVVADRGIPCVD